MACHHKQPIWLDRFSKNALYGRFFILVFLCLQYNLVSAETFKNDICVSTHFDEKAEIKKIVDGDTVILSDDRHIRLVGINTPELKHDGTPAEAGAEMAKARLEQIIQQNKSIYLQYDSEQFDRYKRTLAHLFLKEGTNIQALLLAEGLALPLAIPPNLRNLECYLAALGFARENKHGLWDLPRYQGRAVSKLSGKERGFYIISGTVQRIGESRSSIWLNLGHNVALRIAREDLPYFNIQQLTSLRHKHVQAKGWLYRKKGQLRMRLRHNSDLSIM